MTTMSSPERTSLDQRWQAYQDLTALTNHWYWRPGWRLGRSFYTWHLTFENQHHLHTLVRQVQAQIDVPGLDLVPIEGLHLTMQGLGFTDEVSDEDVQAIVTAVRERCQTVAPFSLRLGPVDPDAEGVGLLVDPWHAVDDLRTAVRAGIGARWNDVPEPAAGFRPHVTVAYSGSGGSVSDVRSRLADLREIPPAAVEIRDVKLIALRRQDREYRWETIAAVPLASGGHRD